MFSLRLFAVAVLFNVVLLEKKVNALRTVFEARSAGVCEDRNGRDPNDVGWTPASAVSGEVPYIRVGWTYIVDPTECVDAMKSFDVSTTFNNYNYMGGTGGYFEAALCGSSCNFNLT